MKILLASLLMFIAMNCPAEITSLHTTINEEDGLVLIWAKTAYPTPRPGQRHGSLDGPESETYLACRVAVSGDKASASALKISYAYRKGDELPPAGFTDALGQIVPDRCGGFGMASVSGNGDAVCGSAESPWVSARQLGFRSESISMGRSQLQFFRRDGGLLCTIAVSHPTGGTSQGRHEGFGVASFPTGSVQILVDFSRPEPSITSFKNCKAATSAESLTRLLSHAGIAANQLVEPDVVDLVATPDGKSVFALVGWMERVNGVFSARYGVLDFSSAKLTRLPELATRPIGFYGDSSEVILLDVTDVSDAHAAKASVDTYSRDTAQSTNAIASCN